jgi:hypothetical protein
MHIVIERDIQKFKDTWTMYWICPYLSLSNIDI